LAKDAAGRVLRAGGGPDENRSDAAEPAEEEHDVPEVLGAACGSVPRGVRCVERDENDVRDEHRPDRQERAPDHRAAAPSELGDLRIDKFHALPSKREVTARNVSSSVARDCSSRETPTPACTSSRLTSAGPRPSVNVSSSSFWRDSIFAIRESAASNL